MKIYQADYRGVFVGEFDAHPDPLTPGEFLTPGGAVNFPPPALKDNETAQLVNNEWVIIPDYRGHVYWLADRTSYMITEAGIVPPTDSFDSEPPLSLDDHKFLKNTEINANRDAKVFANVSALGTQFQADQKSRDLLNEAILLSNAGLPLPSIWRDANNNNVVITKIDQLIEIAAAMAKQTQDAYTYSWAKKKEVEDAQTPEDIVKVIA